MKTRLCLLAMWLFFLSVLSLPAAQADPLTITFTFAGDCVVGAGARVYGKLGSYIDFIKTRGPEYPFAKVRDLFAGDDVTMVNLEGVLQDSADGKRSGPLYHFRGPTAYTQILTLAGIEAVNLGNNHSMDYGLRGLQSTRDALNAAGIGYCIDEDVYYYHKQGVTVAVLGFRGSGFTPRNAVAERLIPELKQSGVQFIIVHLHSGTEYSNRHSSATQAIARRLIDIGADFIVGHHPHVLQGVEVYKNRTILYSLGNFSFGGIRGVRNAAIQTMAVRLTVVFDERYQSQQITLYPARSAGYTQKEWYQPVLVGGKEADAIINLVQKDTAFPLQPYREGFGAVQDILIRDPFEDRTGGEWLVTDGN